MAKSKKSKVIIIAIIGAAAVVIAALIGKIPSSPPEKQPARDTQIITKGTDNAVVTGNDNTTTKKESDEKVTSLVLTMEKVGWFDAISDGRLYEFTLSNPDEGIAMVEKIGIEVLDVIEDNYPQKEAVPAKFNYTIMLDPAHRGRIAFAEDFKYGGGEADKISVLLKTKEKGFDYFFRFYIDWYDTLLQTKKKMFSGIYCARFPSIGIFFEDGDTTVRKRFQEHNQVIWERLDQLNNEHRLKQE